MIVAELPFFRVVLGVYYLIAIELDLIVIIFVILEGRIASQDAFIHPKTPMREGAEAMLVTPQPAG